MAKILWRSFFVQGAWNFKGMQNTGFTHAMMPGLKAMDPNASSPASRPYTGFFNTHPYMAPTIMGVFLHMEQEGQQERIEAIGISMSGSLAALGDTFFWGALKPNMALICLIGAISGRIWIMTAAIVLFNLVHLWVMIRGFSLGYKKGMHGALDMGKRLSAKRTKALKWFIPFLIGAAICMLPGFLQITGHRGKDLGLALVIFVASLAASRFKMNPLQQFYGMFIIMSIWFMI
ncbi:MAG: PTS system mannose/fructose/sorbose family transporter subunit IID [Thermodesulfobacteriota bacterium]|nr:PTS system mannose/fructose/sorbose family transporter subunit IID [Thermodesulfobacteriota bacterium]